MIAAVVVLSGAMAFPEEARKLIHRAQLEIRGGSGPIIIGPGGSITAPGAMEMEPAASAVFEPEFAQVGRPVEYRVTITGSQRIDGLPEPPATPGLSVAAAGRSVGTQVLNGALVMSSTFRFSATPLRAGKLTIPGFDVMVGAKRVRIPAVTLVAGEPVPGEAQYQAARAWMDVPVREFFVGETIAARLLVSETPDESPQFVAHVAKTTGAAVFRPSMRPRREQFTVEGREMSGLVMPVQITPILEGESELGCQVLVHVQKLDPLGRRNGFNMQTTLDAKPARIRVLALPKVGRLPGFTGAIGQFKIAQPRLSADEVEAGEPLTLTLAVAGEGNLEGVAAPEIESAAGWRAYKPTSDFQTDPDDPQSGRGTKVFTYTLVPEREGLRATPPMPFSYFDPVQRAYVDITVPPLPVNVKPSSAGTASPSGGAVRVEPAPVTEPPKPVDPAMTGLEEKPGRWVRSLGPVLGARWFVQFQAVPPVLLLLLWLWRRRREHLAANPQIIRRRRARRAAGRALAEARTAAGRGDSQGFLRAGAGALREAASPLDSARAESLTRDEVLRLLNGDPHAAEVARRVLDSVEAANYSSAGAAKIECDALLPDLERAVQTLARRA